MKNFKRISTLILSLACLLSITACNKEELIDANLGPNEKELYKMATNEFKVTDNSKLIIDISYKFNDLENKTEYLPYMKKLTSALFDKSLLSKLDTAESNLNGTEAMYSFSYIKSSGDKRFSYTDSENRKYVEIISGNNTYTDRINQLKKEITDKYDNICLKLGNHRWAEIDKPSHNGQGFDNIAENLNLKTLFTPEKKTVKTSENLQHDNLTAFYISGQDIDEYCKSISIPENEIKRDIDLYVSLTRNPDNINITTEAKNEDKSYSISVTLYNAESKIENIDIITEDELQKVINETPNDNEPIETKEKDEQYVEFGEEFTGLFQADWKEKRNEPITLRLKEIIRGEEAHNLTSSRGKLDYNEPRDDQEYIVLTFDCDLSNFNIPESGIMTLPIYMRLRGKPIRFYETKPDYDRDIVNEEVFELDTYDKIKPNDLPNEIHMYSVVSKIMDNKDLAVQVEAKQTRDTGYIKDFYIGLEN